MADATANMSASSVWWSAIRPATLAASVAPVLAGTAIAVHEGGLRWWAGIAALVVALGMQVGVNLANDYSDHVRGADRQRVGPLRAASSGVIDPARVRWAAIAAFGVAAAAGVAVSLAVDWRLLLVGAACLLAGWLYTGGPRPYGYLRPGEGFRVLVFWPLPPVGTVYFPVGPLTPAFLLVGCGLRVPADA